MSRDGVASREPMALEEDHEHLPEDRTCFVFKGLVESPDPFKASQLSRFNFFNLVTEEDPANFLVGIVLSPWGSWGWVDGSDPAQAILDLQYATHPIGLIEQVGALPPLPKPQLEVIPIKTDHGDSVFADLEIPAHDDVDPQLRKLVKGRDAVPQGMPDPMWDFMDCAVTVPGAAILILLSSASPLEQSMADSYWQSAFQGGEDKEWQMWRGTQMIRARSFLCSDIGWIPSRMRAERKIMSQRIGFSELSPADREELRHPSVETVKGFAVPFGVYQALVPLPSAGVGRRVLGIPTVKEAAATVPLDPAPEPATPFLRQGEALATDGTRFPVGQGPADYLRHKQIIGQPGSGKTTLEVNDCVQFASSGVVGAGYLDPHGDGSRRVLRDLSPSCPTRVWFVDHGDPDHIVPINPLDAPDEASFARAIAATNDAMQEYVDPKREGMWAERMTRIFTMVGTAYWHLGTVSLPLIATTVGSQDLCRKLASRVEPVKPALAKQIMDELGSLSSSDSRDVFAWAGSRLGQMLNSPLLMKILGTGANAIDMAGIMDRGETLLVDLGSSRLGPDAVRVLEMSYLILMDLAKNRREHREKPFVAIVDEAHTVQIGPLTSLLDEGRKFGVGVEVAHQRLGQLDRQIADALEADTATFVCLRTGVNDGARASIRLRDWPVSDLSRMPAFQAAAVICHDGVPTEPFTLFIDPPKTYEGTDADEREANAQRIIDETIATFSLPYVSLEPITPDNIRDFLGSPADPDRHAQLAALRTGPVTKETQLTRLASDLRSLAETKRAQDVVDLPQAAPDTEQVPLDTEPMDLSQLFAAQEDLLPGQHHGTASAVIQFLAGRRAGD